MGSSPCSGLNTATRGRPFGCTVEKCERWHAGIDLTTDVSDATLFLQIPPAGRNGPPDMVIAVRGKFNVQNIDRISKVVGPVVRVGGGAMIPGVTDYLKGLLGVDCKAATPAAVRVIVAFPAAPGLRPSQQHHAKHDPLPLAAWRGRARCGPRCRPA